MTRTLIVKSEPPARVADPAQSAGVGVPRHRRDRAGGFGIPTAIERAKWVEAEGVQDVREDQLLMLLLVIQAQCHQFGDFGARCRPNELIDTLIDDPPIPMDFVETGPRHHASRSTRYALTDGVTIGVEEVAKPG